MEFIAYELRINRQSFRLCSIFWEGQRENGGGGKQKQREKEKEKGKTKLRSVIDVAEMIN